MQSVGGSDCSIERFVEPGRKTSLGETEAEYVLCRKLGEEAAASKVQRNALRWPLEP
jgi:hypothetical protein